MVGVKLKIDINNGIIEIDSEEAAFDRVCDQASKLLASFSESNLSRNEAVSAYPSEKPLAQEPINSNGENKKSSAKQKRRASGIGTAASWEMVDDLVSREQLAKLKGFYSEKSPTNQNEKIAVITVKSAELVGRQEFDGNDIYTAFRLLDEKVPGDIKGVFKNMKQSGLGKLDKSKFRQA